MGAGEFPLARGLCFELMRISLGGIAAQPAKPSREVEGPEEAYPVWALTLKGFLPPVPSKVAETQALLVSPSPIGEKTSVALPRLLPRPSRVAEKAVTNMAMNRMNMEAYCPMP